MLVGGDHSQELVQLSLSLLQKSLWVNEVLHVGVVLGKWRQSVSFVIRVLAKVLVQLLEVIESTVDLVQLIPFNAHLRMLVRPSFYSVHCDLWIHDRLLLHLVERDNLHIDMALRKITDYLHTYSRTGNYGWVRQIHILVDQIRFLG